MGLIDYLDNLWKKNESKYRKARRGRKTNAVAVRRRRRKIAKASRRKNRGRR